jgi:3-oxoacyl-[acyl-carrier protein] reductase
MVLAGKVAFVTGAARGIGESIALRFQAEGAEVVVADRDADGATRVAKSLRARGGKATAIHMDISIKGQVDRTVEEAIAAHGRIDVWVNNAAHARYGLAVELAEEDWNYGVANGLTGTFLCSQAAAKHMLTRGSGKIINISSVSARVALTRTVAHAASKAGLEAITRVMALELAPHGVQVNAIASGPVETAYSREVLSVEEIEARRRGVPAGRLGDVSDVAGVACFLASADADWMTGSVVVVDGGFSSAGRA